MDVLANSVDEQGGEFGGLIGVGGRDQALGESRDVAVGVPIGQKGVLKIFGAH